MRPRLSPPALWLGALLALAAVRVPGADAPAAPAPAAAPPAGTAPAPDAANPKAWVMDIPSPMRPTRIAGGKDEADGRQVLRRASPTLGAGGVNGGLPQPEDDRLMRIAQTEQEFLDTLTRQPDAWPPAERDRRAQEINDSYEKYLGDNRHNVLAIILYGKFLRRVGERDQAYAVFQRAYRLDPKLAVVNQQLGGYLAEEGQFMPALGFFLQAVALAPQEPLYHYQLGELLDVYYDLLLRDKVYTIPTLNAAIVAEFNRAAELNPQEPVYAWRQAECYYDLLDPDWTAALAAWDKLGARVTIPLARDAVRLHRARVLLELDRRDEARGLLEPPVPPFFEEVRQQLLLWVKDGHPPGAPAPAAATPPPAAPATAPAQPAAPPPANP